MAGKAIVISGLCATMASITACGHQKVEGELPLDDSIYKMSKVVPTEPTDTIKSDSCEQIINE